VVVGASGSIGGTVARVLRAHGESVRAVVRDSSRGADLAAVGCEIAVADIHDASSIAEAIEGADAVHAMFPTAPQARDSQAEMRAAIDSLVEALAAASAPHVLAISDYGAQLDSGTGVTLSFHYLETRMRELPGALTLVRSAEHMQNWRRQAPAATRTGVLPSLHHPLSKTFPTVFSPDVGRISAELLLGGHPGGGPRIVHVEGPRRYTAIDVASTLTALVGTKVHAKELPHSQWRDALLRGGLGQSYAELVVELFAAHNAGRIDAEPGVGEIRRGTTELREALSHIVHDERPAGR
jgi:NAD(P)H dehydrogenase (quinone)